MRPSQLFHYSVALLRGNVKHFAKLPVCGAALSLIADGLYITIRKFAHAMLNAAGSYKPVFGVQDVLTMRNPLKVFNPIVCRIKINMIDFKASGAGADEKRSDKAMNKHPFFCAIFTKLDSAMSVLAFFWRQHQLGFASSMNFANTFNTAKVGNKVARFMPWDGLPNFVHIQFPMIGKTRVKAHGGWHGNQCSGATLAMQGVL